MTVLTSGSGRQRIRAAATWLCQPGTTTTLPRSLARIAASTTCSAVCKNIRGAASMIAWVPLALGELGPGEAGADRRDPHSGGAILRVQGLAELDHQALDPRIERVARHAGREGRPARRC